MPSSRNNRGGRDQERRDREQREEIERLRRIKEEQERVLAELRRKNEIIKADMRRNGYDPDGGNNAN